MIRAGYGIFYGGEENQGGSPNRGEGIPFNETVNMDRTPGVVSSFLGINDPNCTGCQYMPGGLTGGFPDSPFTLNAQHPVPRRPAQLPQPDGPQMEPDGAA